jgi:hypothetical protein
MSIHLQKFIERIRGHEARGVKEFVMPIADAKGMAADLTELLLELNQLKTEKLAGSQEVVQIKLAGGGFK